jgi:hypothetical protein
VLPTYYLFGQFNVLIHNRGGHSAGLLGEYRSKGWWYYFPVAFALKTTIPFLLVAVGGLLWGLYQALIRRDNRFLWLLIPVAIYASLAMSANINIGVRHFLPAYPFLIIGAAVLLERLLTIKRARVVTIAVAAVLLMWMSVEMARTYPNYIPYMNQLAVGKPHWWYLSDSNVEWGDDVKELASYLRARGETEVRGAVAGAWTTLDLYGIKYHEMQRPSSKIPETRYIAIGTGFLNGSTIGVSSDENGKALTQEQRVNSLDLYRHLQPEAIIGNTIYVYRVK